MPPPTWRDEAFERLGGDRFDLLVIGAGILGARIAFDAAAAGLRVALVDRGDIGGATSSASSKLVHGGFRYLRSAQVRLVREARRERAWLLRSAPTLVRPMPVLTVVRRGGPHARVQLAAGLMAYRALSIGAGAAGRFVTAEAAIALVPGLTEEGLRTSFILDEAVTDDARLTLATARGAARFGATVTTYAEVVALDVGRRLSGAVVRDLMTGRERSCTASAIVNATGPWIDVIRRLERPTAPPTVRFAKGVHATLPLPVGWRVAVAVPVARGREVHAIPWRGLLLVGTTHDRHDGPPAAVAADDAEIDQVLTGLCSALRPGTLECSRVLARYAGLRALPLGRATSGAATREPVIDVSPGGLVSVAGGKLTTHRATSHAVLARLSPTGVPGRAGRDIVLPGGQPARPDAALAERLGASVYDHLAAIYGDELDALAVGLADDGLQRIHPDGPDVWAQVDHAIRHEWAVTADDVLARRTSLTLRGLATPAVSEAVSNRIREAL